MLLSALDDYASSNSLRNEVQRGIDRMSVSRLQFYDAVGHAWNNVGNIQLR